MATEQSTIYSTIPMQIFMMNSIKKPILESVEIIFNPDASKIDKVKAARKLWKAVQLISKMPEPTLEGTWHPNSHNLIILRDWLCERCFLATERMGLIRRLMNFIIILYDFDPPWRWVLDSVKDEALKMEWKSRGYEDVRTETYAWWRE
ncbi:hypothetical protein LCGC14_0365510 [marine sediment metagenome]|uniref:Uncharacterized protein n=1 Tax=marine sediment metagenome TaxID=412755 RepID=A0A0F9T6R5_9ZZZZ